MKRIQPIQLITLIISVLAFSNVNAGSLDIFNCVSQKLSTFTLDCPHWYVSGNIGLSHLYDQPTPDVGATTSVSENGPGWNVNGGYQFNSIWGGELGYTQYHESRETTGPFYIADTEHYAVHLAATARYPLACQLSVLGKLGAAYSYANKVFNLTAGPAVSSGAVSAYGALGLAYSITPKVDLVLQGAGVRGNNFTGSSTLYSLGMVFAII